jgi:hypothetical protein
MQHRFEKKRTSAQTVHRNGLQPLERKRYDQTMARLDCSRGDRHTVGGDTGNGTRHALGGK